MKDFIKIANNFFKVSDIQGISIKEKDNIYSIFFMFNDGDFSCDIKDCPSMEEAEKVVSGIIKNAGLTLCEV